MKKILCFLLFGAFFCSFTQAALHPVKNKRGYYGYADDNGKLVIPHKWKRAMPFSEGVAFVCANDNPFRNCDNGLIDSTGQYVAYFSRIWGFKYDSLVFHNGFATKFDGSYVSLDDCLSYPSTRRYPVRPYAFDSLKYTPDGIIGYFTKTFNNKPCINTVAFDLDGKLRVTSSMRHYRDLVNYIEGVTYYVKFYNDGSFADEAFFLNGEREITYYTSYRSDKTQMAFLLCRKDGTREGIVIVGTSQGAAVYNSKHEKLFDTTLNLNTWDGLEGLAGYFPEDTLYQYCLNEPFLNITERIQTKTGHITEDIPSCYTTYTEPLQVRDGVITPEMLAACRLVDEPSTQYVHASGNGMYALLEEEGATTYLFYDFTQGTVRRVRLPLQINGIGTTGRAGRDGKVGRNGMNGYTYTMGNGETRIHEGENGEDGSNGSDGEAGGDGANITLYLSANLQSRISEVYAVVLGGQGGKGGKAGRAGWNGKYSYNWYRHGNGTYGSAGLSYAREGYLPGSDGPNGKAGTFIVYLFNPF